MIVANSEIVKQDALFDLVKSLSKAEKRNFKLYATRMDGNADAKFILLFDTLDDLEEYDEARILAKCPVKKGQLPNLKSHLYRQILVSVRLINVQHSIAVELHEQIDFARILYDKGLYKQSLKILDKAKKLALSKELNTSALEIVEFEKSIETLHRTRSGTSRAELLSLQTTELCRLVDSTNLLSNISIQLYGLYLKLGYVRSERDVSLVTGFFGPKLKKYSDKELSFTEKLQLYNALMWYSYIQFKFTPCFKYSMQLVQLFDDQPQMREIYYDQYLKGFSRHLETLFLTGSYRRLKENIARFETDICLVFENNIHAVVISQMTIYTHKINIHYMEGSFNEGIKLVEPLEKFLKKYSTYIDFHYKMLFYYKIACMYFGNGNYAECIEYLQRIITSREVVVRRDLQCFARILNLIASYESRRDYNLDYQIKSVYTFIVRMNDMHAVQREMMNFLKKLNVIYASDVKAELKALYDRLLPYSQHPYERRTFFYLDIISWLESKIKGVTVAEIIQEKFRKQKVR